jgi:hypothetical protein
VAYVDQFEHLIRAGERGRAIASTRTIVVFSDGLVVCDVPVPEAARPPVGLLDSLRRIHRPSPDPGRGDEHIRISAQAAGSCLTFAPTWPKTRVFPFAVVDKIVLTRPRQVSELTIVEQTPDPARPDAWVYLGDLSAARVRAALEPALGDRLEIRAP